MPLLNESRAIDEADGEAQLAWMITLPSRIATAVVSLDARGLVVRSRTYALWRVAASAVVLKRQIASQYFSGATDTALYRAYAATAQVSGIRVARTVGNQKQSLFLIDIQIANGAHDLLML